MAVARDDKYIESYGSAEWVYAECTSLGQITGPWTQGPYVATTEYKWDRASENKPDENGDPHYTKGTKEVGVTMTTMQRGPDELIFMTETLADKYVSIIKQMNGQTINSNYYYRFYPLCKPVESCTFSAPGNEVTMDFNILKVNQAVNEDMSSADALFTATVTSLVTVDSGGFLAQFDHT